MGRNRWSNIIQAWIGFLSEWTGSEDTVSSYLSQFLQLLIMFWNTVITTYVPNLKEIHRIVDIYIHISVEIGFLPDCSCDPHEGEAVPPRP